MTAHIEYNQLVLPVKDYLHSKLNLSPLKESQKRQITVDFSSRARELLNKPSSRGPGPLMLHSLIKPPNTEPKFLEGKSAIGIDVGGTNLRMGSGIVKNGAIQPKDDKLPTSTEIKIKYESLDEFFDMLMENGLEQLLKDNPDAPLACIFSFPGEGCITNYGIDLKLPNTLTKEWVIRASAGKNIGVELNKFLEKRGLKKRNYLFANDTVALIKKDIVFGIVCASGYNLSVVYDNEIINTESGSSESAPTLPIITDRLLEAIAQEENKPVSEIPIRDEYRVSGKYLGRTLGLIVDDIKNSYPKLFKKIRNTDFRKSFIVSDILNGHWNKVKNHFESKDNIPGADKQVLTEIANSLRDVSAQIVACHLVSLAEICEYRGTINIASDGPIIQNMPGWKEVFLNEVKSLSSGQLNVKIMETPYQGKRRDYRGIFDVMYHAAEFFNDFSPPAEFQFNSKKQGGKAAVPYYTEHFDIANWTPHKGRTNPETGEPYP